MADVRPFALALALCGVAAPALAHVPIIPKADPTSNAPFVIEGFEDQSRAIFQKIGSPLDFDVYEVVVTTPVELAVQIGVPLQCTSGEDARPTVAVYGPVTGPIELSPVIGKVDWHQVEVFDDDYSGFSFALGPQIRFSQVLPGRYRIYVWDPAGKTGDYLLNYNESESAFSQFLPQVQAACADLADVNGAFYPTCQRKVTPPQCCQFGVTGGACTGAPAPATSTSGTPPGG